MYALREGKVSRQAVIVKVKRIDVYHSLFRNVQNEGRPAKPIFLNLLFKNALFSNFFIFHQHLQHLFRYLYEAKKKNYFSME